MVDWDSLKTADRDLAEAFGRYSERWQPSDPLTDLIETVLGQRTTNTHARKAMANLRAACRSWDEVAALPYDTLVDLVRPAGLAKQKAGWIQAILHRLFADTGEFSLDHLSNLDNRAAARYLCSLPGVGAHSAALVLLFAMGRRGVMPVDTHIHRVARRLGWAPHDASPGKVQTAIEGAGPAENLMDLHVNLIRLGHKHCGPSTLDCRDCPLSDLCATARRQPFW